MEPFVGLAVVVILALPFLLLTVAAVLKVSDVVTLDPHQIHRSFLGRRESIAWLDVCAVGLDDERLVIRDGATVTLAVERTHPAYPVVRMCVLAFLRPIWIQDLRSVFHLDPLMNVVGIGLTAVFFLVGVSSLRFGVWNLILALGCGVLAILMGMTWGMLPQRVRLQERELLIESWRGAQVLRVDEVVSIDAVSGYLPGSLAVRLTTRTNGSFDLQNMREGGLRLYLSLVEWRRALNTAPHRTAADEPSMVGAQQVHAASTRA
ncbi:MAG TPA: hypothetical protein PK954_09005 [Anaerolineales bacterium]|nr:hypothetical protein [Anaerolineales bacterium]